MKTKEQLDQKFQDLYDEGIELSKKSGELYNLKWNSGEISEKQKYEISELQKQTWEKHAAVTAQMALINWILK